MQREILVAPDAELDELIVQSASCGTLAVAPGGFDGRGVGSGRVSRRAIGPRDRCGARAIRLWRHRTLHAIRLQRAGWHWKAAPGCLPLPGALPWARRRPDTWPAPDTA